MPEKLEVIEDFSAEGMLFSKGEILSFSQSFIKKYGENLKQPEAKKATKNTKEEE